MLGRTNPTFRPWTQNPSPQGVPVRVRPRAPTTYVTAPRKRSAFIPRGVPHLVGVCIAVLMLACSRSDEVATAQSPLQFFGDSTQVQAFELLREHFPSATLRAVGGTRSDMLLDGTDGLNRPWPASVAAPVVVINHGMNDARPWAKVPLDAYRANLRRLAKAPALVVFETPNPSTYPGRDTAPYAQAMREVAAEVGAPLIDVHACFQTLPDWRAALYDQVHPNERGLRHIVDVCVAPRLRAIMQRVT
jgi:hypothetical protein